MVSHQSGHFVPMFFTMVGIKKYCDGMSHDVFGHNIGQTLSMMEVVLSWKWAPLGGQPLSMSELDVGSAILCRFLNI